MKANWTNHVRKELDLDRPEPGIYFGISIFDYFAIKAVSQSSLKKWKEAPEMYLHEEDRTPATIFGHQYHAFVLETDSFYERYCAGPQERRSKTDKEHYQKLCDSHGGPEYVYRPKEFAEMDEMCRTLITSYPRIATLLDNDQPGELTLVWRDDETGLLCKARIDKAHLELDWLIDLKTTADALKAAFRRSIFKYGYDKQAAFYLRGAYQLEIPCRNFAIVAQEKKPPYLVRSYQISQSVIENADWTISEMLTGFKEWQTHLNLPDEVISIEWESTDF